MLLSPFWRSRKPYYGINMTVLSVFMFGEQLQLGNVWRAWFCLWWANASTDAVTLAPQQASRYASNERNIAVLLQVGFLDIWDNHKRQNCIKLPVYWRPLCHTSSSQYLIAKPFLNGITRLPKRTCYHNCQEQWLNSAPHANSFWSLADHWNGLQWSCDAWLALPPRKAMWC